VIVRLHVISDLHLGRGDRTDRFGHSVSRFHRFLDFLERGADTVVLLGDVLDTHHGLVPFDYFREVRKITGTYPGLVERLLSGKYPLVHGNHDDCLARLPGVKERIIYDADGQRVLLMHGHQFDRLIRLAPNTCAAFNWLAGRLEAAGMKGPLAMLDKIDDLANGLTRDRSEIYREQAVASARSAGATIIVMGHLHRQDLHRADGVTYVNTGSCLGGRFQYAAIDTASGTAEAKEWTG